MKFSAPHADLFQSPRLQDAEGKRGHSRTQSSQIPPVEPDSERQSGTAGHTGEGIPGTSPDISVADGSQVAADRGDTNLTCSVCHAEGVMACPIHRPLPHLVSVGGHAIDPRTNRCWVCDKAAAQIEEEAA